jgi:hypothetical protein
VRLTPENAHLKVINLKVCASPGRSDFFTPSAALGHNLAADAADPAPTVQSAPMDGVPGPIIEKLSCLRTGAPRLT